MCLFIIQAMLFCLFQVAAIRQHLADIYERESSWREAANVLVGIPLETGQKYDRCAHFCLITGIRPLLHNWLH